MEASLSSSWYVGTHLQASYEDYINTPCSSLVEEESMNAPFIPSSPSFDMEAALQHLSSSSCESEWSSSPISSEEADTLMDDTFLDFLNEVMMEEGTEVLPGSISQQDAEAYYQATLSSLYDIIGEHSPSVSNTTGAHVSTDYVASHDPSAHKTSSGFEISWHKDRQYEQPIDFSKPSLGFNSLSSEINDTGFPSRSLADRGNPYTNIKEQEAESHLFTAQNSLPIHLEQCHGQTSTIPAMLNSKLSGDQGKAEGGSVTTRSSYLISDVDKGEPEILSHGSVKAAVSQVDSMTHYQHLHESDTPADGICRGLGNTTHTNLKELQDQKKGPDNQSLLLLVDHATLKSANTGMQVEEITDEAGYAALYVEKPTTSIAAQGASLNGDKKSSNRARKSRKPGRKSNTEVLGFVDIREVLVSCAQAVAVGDGKRTNEILQELYLVHGVSFNGNGLQRAAHYFCEALMARMGGIGGQRHREMCANMPSAVTFLKTTKAWYERSPQMRILHYFGNQNILKAAEGASRLHIVDYGILYGLQWPYLMKALAGREGGPPLLVITGIEFPKPDQDSLEWLKESGRRLAAYAKNCNVPFEFHPIVTDKWEDIGPASLHLHADEVVVINCMKRLRHLPDESMDLASAISPRQKLLMSMHSLKPNLLITADSSAGCNSPFFVSRFREALYFYTNIFDMLDNLWNDRPDRAFLESHIYARDILNVVACEGAERVERPETYRQWDVRIKRAGFEELPISPVVLSRSRSHIKQHFHPDFMIHDDGKGWMLLGWKGRAITCVCAWVPCRV